MFESAKEILRRLGLKEDEVKVYMACLENKPGLFVSDLTRLTKIKRSTINLILDRLVKKGFVTYHLDGARKLFSAEAPETLLFQFEDSLNDLRSLIPLIRVATGSDSQSKVRFFEGKEGIEKIFTDALLTMKINKDPKKEILAISSGMDLLKTFPDHQKQFMEKRAKAGIPLRWIAPDSPVARELNGRDLRTLKFFDGTKYKFNVEIDIYANKIALISLSKEPNGVIIENKELTASFKSIFNLIWDSLR